MDIILYEKYFLHIQYEWKIILTLMAEIKYEQSTTRKNSSTRKNLPCSHADKYTFLISLHD